MRNYPNIEKHPFNRCECIGYAANGVAYRITWKSGWWNAQARKYISGSVHYFSGCKTLAEVSAKLEGIK